MTAQYFRILLVLGMIAAVCGTASAGMGIIAETQVTSAGDYPACNAPCECISENEAAARWGAEGYDRCSKTICGQSATGSVQYYCLHQVGGVSSARTAAASTYAPSLVTSQAPAPVQTTVQAPVLTPATAAVTSAAPPAEPSPSYTWPAASATPQKTPVGAATILAAIGFALVAAAGARRH